MTEDQKQQTAVFRFGVIADLVSGNLDPGDQERLILEKSHRKWSIPFSTKTRISRSTILRWIRLYRNSNGNLRSLYPKERSDRGKSRAVTTGLKTRQNHRLKTNQGFDRTQVCVSGSF